jgi:predicted pyridoxine 5'-phosphate oxidase superfamily flavin-nucleotide-binding protein
MVKIPEEVMKLLNDKESIKVLATVDAKGIPNAVPVYSIMCLDEGTIGFAEIFIIKTKQNLELTKKTTVLGIKGGKAFQLKGTFQGFQYSGPIFDMFAKTIMGTINLKIKSVGTIKVEDIFSATPGEGSKKIA